MIINNIGELSGLCVDCSFLGERSDHFNAFKVQLPCDYPAAAVWSFFMVLRGTGGKLIQCQFWFYPPCNDAINFYNI